MDTPCIPGPGTPDANGYCHITHNGRQQYAHRVAWTVANGPISPGLLIGHVCHDEDATCPGGRCAHRSCWNVEHLRPMTPKENMANARTSKRASPRRARRDGLENAHDLRAR